MPSCLKKQVSKGVVLSTEHAWARNFLSPGRIHIWICVGVAMAFLMAGAHAREIFVDQTNPKARDFLTGGSEEVPFKTLSAACRVAKAGDTVYVFPGVYREILVPRHSGEEGNPVVFEAVGQGVWIKGSEVFTDWEFESGFWVKRPWHPSLGSFTIPSGDNEKGKRPQLHLDQVFVDGTPLQLSQDRASTPNWGFWWAPDGSGIALKLPEGTDPNQCLVEIPVREAVVASWPETDVPRNVAEATKDGKTLEELGLPEINWIVIRGFQFAHNVSEINRGGVRIQGLDWTLENNTVEWMNTNGIQVDNRTTLRNNTTRLNGQSGYFSGAGVEGVLMEGNASLWDCWPRFATGWGGGGMKCVTVSDFVVRDHTSVGSYGAGIWFDWNCSDATVENCTVVSSNTPAHGGIFLEFSSGAKVSNNVVFGVGVDRGTGPYGAAVTVSSTSEVTISDNTALLCQGGVGILGGPRGGDPPFFARNVTVTDNLLVGMEKFAFSLFLSSAFSKASGNRVMGNTIAAPAAGAGVALDGRIIQSIEEVTKAGQGTIADNRWLSNWEDLHQADAEKVSSAARRLLLALHKVGILSSPVADSVSAQGIWHLAGGNSRGLAVHNGSKRFLLVSHAGESKWSFQEPTAQNVEVFDSKSREWKSVPVVNGRVSLTSDRGFSLVTGLSADAKP
jgi:parallel beta-helix repeat protein